MILPFPSHSSKSIANRHVLALKHTCTDAFSPCLAPPPYPSPAMVSCPRRCLTQPIPHTPTSMRCFQHSSVGLREPLFLIDYLTSYFTEKNRSKLKRTSTKLCHHIYSHTCIHTHPFCLSSCYSR